MKGPGGGSPPPPLWGRTKEGGRAKRIRLARGPPRLPAGGAPPHPEPPHKGGGCASDASSLDSARRTSALAGLRVVELARILAGPLIGQTLADLGADVIKVESPEGDDTRKWGPPFIETGEERAAAYFHGCNRGKRSIIADFSTERGREIVRAPRGALGRADREFQGRRARQVRPRL